MKILAVSDIVVDRLYSSHLKEFFPAVDLVLGCGDLPYEFLEFLVSSLNVPLLYVPGNHDPFYDTSNPAARADGCENIDRRVTQVKGLTIAGLGGSILYKPAAVNQYTQAQMRVRAGSLAPALLWSHLRSGHRLDIMVAHSPPLGIQDEDDQPHVGFAAFVGLIKIFRPRFFLHGHTLPRNQNLEGPLSTFSETQVINVNPYRLIDMEPYA